jgi:hypothetical protein
MTINFTKNIAVTVKNDTPVKNPRKPKKHDDFNSLENEIFKHSVKNNKYLTSLQISNYARKISESGYIIGNDENLAKLVEDFFRFKSYFPRTIYKKSWFIEAKDIVSKLPTCYNGENEEKSIHAEKIFYACKKICHFNDELIYHWFEKLNNKFSTFGVYTPEICIMVIYSAIAYKEKK